MCNIEQSDILPCGSVWFSNIVNAVRFGFVINPTERVCAILKDRISYGAVRCGFRNTGILRWGSVL